MVSASRTGRTRGKPGIAYEVQGDGPAVVFLHGIGGHRGNWADQLGCFSRHYRAVAWDARGYGDSDGYDGPCRFEDFSDDLAGLLDHLDVERAHLVGLSMGGRILMDFAVRHAGRVRSLVVAGSFPSFGSALTSEQQQEYMRLRREPLQRGLSFAQLAPQLVASLVGPRANALVLERMAESIARLRPDAYLKTLEATLHFDRTATLGEIEAPTLLMYGQFDSLVTPEAGRQVQQAMRHAEYRVVEGVGHLINLEAPDVFNALVLDFLARHGDERRGT